jgi:hypothetical protein
MDDTTHDTHDTSAGGTPASTNGHASHGSDATGAAGAPDETFGWTDESTSGAGGGDARAAAERMLGQLQAMIDTVATQAGPVVRQIGAKAAELAAVAADRAGPLAHRAADATADASVKIAERSRTLAADLRSRTEANGSADAGAVQPDADQGGIGVAELGGADDSREQAAQDDPAEGAR